MAAAHSDSPCFKVKEKPELTVEDHYLRLNTEKYGGMILVHLDGQTALRSRQTGGVKNGNGIEGRLVNIDRDLCVIPKCGHPYEPGDEQGCGVQSPGGSAAFACGRII